MAVSQFGAGSNELDIRISTFPTMYGESVSLRLLNQKSKPLSMRELGLTKDEEEKVTRTLDAPHGIVLVTGPTGSGKSTSLTAFIRLINRPERRIITVEDPVEYEVPGVNQTQVHADIGLTFAHSLRAVLRQDSDVIMVGEIRDRETADIAIRASLTGHLVLSTLHTNDARRAYPPDRYGYRTLPDRLFGRDDYCAAPGAAALPQLRPAGKLRTASPRKLFDHHAHRSK